MIVSSGFYYVLHAMLCDNDNDNNDNSKPNQMEEK